MILVSTRNGIYGWDESSQTLNLNALEGKDIRQVAARSLPGATER